MSSPENSLRNRLLAGAAFLLFCSVLLLVSWLAGNRANPDQRDEEAIPQPGTPISRFATGSASFAEVAPNNADPVPIPDWQPGSIPDDHVLQFTGKAAMDAFMAQARGAGLEIMGHIPALNAVRVRGPAASIASMLDGEAAQWGANFPTLMPRPLDSVDWDRSGFSAFEGNVLRFLGIADGTDLSAWGKGVKIAVLDTGIQAHPALAGLNIRQIDLVAGGQPGEYSSHGTAVAGFIASQSTVAPGLAPGSELLSVRVLDAAGRGDVFTLAAGIIEAVDAGAVIINMSLGSYGDSPVLRQAVDYAYAAGALLIASSGNDGRNTPTFPAAYDAVMGVAAVDATGSRVPFSNYGEGVDIAAPGFGLHALWEEERYTFFDGTSAATPLVAAAAARLLSSGAARTGEQARDLMQSFANEAGFPGFDEEYGAGVLNIERMESAKTPGIHDIALADFYPHLAANADQAFPLYVTFQNRGTTYLPSAAVVLTVNGLTYRHQFGGMAPGAVQQIQVPVSKAVAAMAPVEVVAEVQLPPHLIDSRPFNNAGRITISIPPPN